MRALALRTGVVTVWMLVAGMGPGGARADAQPAGVVAGTVVAALDGEPLKDAVVELTPVEKGRTTKRKVKADGKFSAELPPGRYTLAASLPGFMLHEETIEVAAGETLSQAVRLKLGRLMETVRVRPRRGSAAGL